MDSLNDVRASKQDVERQAMFSATPKT